MSNRNNRVVTYLTDKEESTLEEWSQRTGKSKSHLVREAVLEYTDHDRYERIEGELAAVHDELQAIKDTLSENGDAHTQTPVNKGNKTIPEKARAVAQHIYDNYDMPIQHTKVELAIENIALVGDERSIENYTEQFKKRGLLYEHPTSEVWTDDKAQWVSWVEGAYHDPDVYDVTEEYKMDTEEYIELAEQ